MSSLLPQCDLVALYVLIDDAVSELRDDVHKVGRPPILTDSEIITMLVYNTLFLHQKNLKNVWDFMKTYHQNDFRKLPKYSAFVDHAHRVLPLMLHILSLTFIKSPVNFADSTMLEVCRLHRSDSHKVAKSMAKYGKNHQGWHYGFKLHAAIDTRGLLSSICFSGADIYDAQMLTMLLRKGMKIVVGDSIYGASVMRKIIWEKLGIIIIAPPHYKQKTKIAALWQTTLLSMRSKIESVYDVLKEHFHLVSSFPRSVRGYFVHYVRVLLAYQFSILFKYVNVANLS